MSPNLRKGLIVAVLHVLLVGSLGGKLLIDRATRPRVWARTAPVDPDLPIRGRYVSLAIEGRARDFTEGHEFGAVSLAVQDQTLVVVPTSSDTGLTAHVTERDGHPVARLDQRLAYFIPEHVPDPSMRAEGEELWVEVTLPARGPPRPIRLGVKKDGVLTPLDLD